MSDVQMQSFIQQAQLLDFNERIEVITYLLGTLQQKEEKKEIDFSFVDNMFGTLSDEEANEMRAHSHLHFKDVL